MKSDVIIIGAGVLGVSLGYHLSKAGKSVVIVEKEPGFAIHASGKNAGMFRLLYKHPQLTEWAYRSQITWPNEVTKNCFQATGSLIAGRTLPNHHRELFEGKSIYDSNKGHPPIACVYSKNDGLLDSYSYVSKLARLSAVNGIKYFFKSEINSIEKIGNNWMATTRDNRVFQAPWVVNAAGAWINDFLTPNYARSIVDAKPYARHLFVVKGWKDFEWPEKNIGYYWDEKTKWYMRKWDTNTKLVSICDKLPARPETFIPEKSIERRLANKLLYALPNIAESLSLGRSWYCFRTYTDDALPIWGEDFQHSGLFWLAAFGGFGMSTSFAASYDAACYISGKSVSISADFLPSRVQQKDKQFMTQAIGNN
jgi:D-arginine dehydrogenase